MKMGLFDTIAEEVCAERLNEAKKGVEDLRNWLGIVSQELEAAIEKEDGRAFPINWCSAIMEKAFNIYRSYLKTHFLW